MLNVYADFAYGDRFYVKLLPFKGKAFKSLNEMERYYINKYHAQEDGYNKTIGNR